MPARGRTDAGGGAGALAVLCLALLALGLLWTTQTVARVERTERVVVRDAWTERAAFETRQEDAFATTAPLAPVAFVWTLEDPRAGEVASEARLLVVASGVREERAWLHRQELARGAGHDALRIEGTLDLPALADATRGAENLTWSLEARVAFVAGAREAASDFAAPFRFDDPLYVLPAGDAARFVREHGEQETVVDETRPGLRALRDAPHHPALALAGAIGLLALWRRERRA